MGGYPVKCARQREQRARGGACLESSKRTRRPQGWCAEYNNQTTQLMKFVDDNNAQLFLLNGDVMDVTLDAQGVEMARMFMNNSFAWR